MTESASGIRVKAIAVIARGQDVLLSFAVDPVSGSRYGRFLGGGVELGERSEETIRRELGEEIGVTVSDVSRLGVVENIFTLGGRTVHEVIVVCAARFADPAAYAVPFYVVNEAVCDGPAEWIPLERVLRGDVTIYPGDLVLLLRHARASNALLGPSV